MANTRKRANSIKIGDAIKTASMTTYEVVQDISHVDGEYPFILFFLANGNIHRAFPGALIWWREMVSAD